MTASGQELAGKVAIVTGGASGIGRATVELFLEQGAKVVIADIDAAGGTALANQLGKDAVFRPTDVANLEAVQAAVDFAVAHFGGLHVMFNNAGLSGKMHPHFLDDDLADFQTVLGVNLLGVMAGTQRAARHMAGHGGGSIINTASIAGVKAGYAVMSYRAAKAGVIHFTRAAAIDLGQYGIRVNVIAPGGIPSQMSSYSEPGMSAATAERVRQAIIPARLAPQPLKRQGAPRDVAYAALYLASDRSSQVTGMLLPVDGGAVAGDTVNHLDAILQARARALASST
jgi:NAD(P)-dependent dehydrogenase (short-subunit alcohol dehydrogenase family)